MARHYVPLFSVNLFLWELGAAVDFAKCHRFDPDLSTRI